MDNFSEVKELTFLQKIVLVAFLLLMLGAYRFVMNLAIINTGIMELRYPRLYLQVIPAIFILNKSFWKRTLKFPVLIPFLLLMAVTVLFEGYLSPYRDVDLHNYNFVWNQVRMYIFFLMLVNFGLNREAFSKVINYSFNVILAICVITYIGYLGFFEMAIQKNINPFVIKSSLFDAAKPHHTLQINAVSYLFTFAILLLIVNQLQERRFYKTAILRSFTTILLLFGLIMINAARGAFLISTIFISYYIYFIWRKGTKDKNTKMLVFVFVVLVSVLTLIKASNDLTKPGSSKFHIALIERSQHDFAPESFRNMVRVINIRNTWDNFLEHPFAGLGFQRAARRGSTGTMSDGQHYHLLAAYGVIFFIFYLYYHFKLFVFRFKLLKKPEIALCFIFVMLSGFFTWPEDAVAIIAYISYYFYNCSKNNKFINGSCYGN